MQLNLLHVDDALKQQSLFMEQCHQFSPRELEASDLAARVRLWGKEPDLQALRQHITTFTQKQQTNDTLVTFLGSGDFHHLSALLIGLLLDQNPEPCTIIHFDNHPDWVHWPSGMHCGSWVNRALMIPQVQKVITLGVCSNDLKWPQFKGANLKAWQEGRIVLLPWHAASERFRSQDIEHVEEKALLALLNQHITTRNVYITLDKDVLSHTDAITNWDQGHMPLARVLAIIRHVTAHHHAIGIDINGDYSNPYYAGPWHHTALKRLEAMIDQPRQHQYKSRAAAVNQVSNLTLLDCLREVL